MASTAPRRTTVASLIVAVWLALGLLSVGQYYFAARLAGQDWSWPGQLLSELPVWQIWSVFTPLAFVVARRFPLEAGRWTRSLPVHVAAALACAFGYLGFWLAWLGITRPEAVTASALADVFWTLFRARFNVAFLLYWAVVGVYYAVANYRRLQARDVDAARSEAALAAARAELAEARHRALRHQLHPHFLFNTLHSVAGLVEEDPAAARRLIARLSELLRTTLDTSEIRELPLAGELEFLDQYLEIERVRLGQRLRVEFDVAPDTRDALVPPLLLQPLLENAIRHGVAPLEEGGTVGVRSWRSGTRLHLEIWNTGSELPHRLAAREGLGLRTTRGRLSQLYGAAHDFQFGRSQQGEVVVSIAIPYRAGEGEAEGVDE